MHPRGLFFFAAALPIWVSLSTGFFAALGAFPARAFAATSPADPEPRRVSFSSEDKLTLVGTYYAAGNAKQKAPAALLVHGAGGSRTDLQALALRLQKSGFAALTVDLRGHGESATPELDWQKLDPAGRLEQWASMTRDVKAGVDFLLEQEVVQATGVSLVGHGAGCALVARHAKRDEKVRDIVLLSPQTEQLGSTLAKDLIGMAGLSICIGVGKDETATAKCLAEISNRAGAGAESAEIIVSKVDAQELLGDIKFLCDTLRWMKSKAPMGDALKATDLKPIH